MTRSDAASSSSGPSPDPPLRSASDAVLDTPFDELHHENRMRAFGVDYAHVTAPEGGDLYLTRYGWPVVRQLMPGNWYVDRYFSRFGQRLPDSTGNVYRVKTRPCDGKSAVDLVVKFSRVGQEVPLEIATSFPDDISAEDIAAARFNSPMEEFGLLTELRNKSLETGALRVLTQKPLAIYVPPERFELWKLGRSRSRFDTHRRRLERDQAEAESDTAVALDIRREYVLLFQWIEGISAEEALRRGFLAQQTFSSLLPRAIDELRALGFRVLDNKPTHLIVRPRHHKPGMARRDDRLAYALVDFELLQPTQAQRQRFKLAQRERYWKLQSRAAGSEATPMPPGLQRMKILGVDYVYGVAPNGGRVWAVGNDPALFDFFLPDRWRRTPRIKLALTREVCRTRTRDNIHVVYRQSRVGERPGTDPFYELGKRIRAYGYNSPFEEVALALTLRRAGLTTIHPRAIYRTGHESIKAGYLLDDRRYELFAEMTTPPPESEPVLSARHDYYVIWGYWRGVDPQGAAIRAGRWNFVDLRKAREDGVLDEDEHAALLDETRDRLLAAGFDDITRDDDEYLLILDRDHKPMRDEQGRLEITLSADALTVFDYGLIEEEAYRRLIERAEAKIHRAGCDPLNLSGNHLLLSMNPDGQLRRDRRGNPQVALCNFELIRMNLCPLDL